MEAARQDDSTSGPLGDFRRRLLPGKGAQQARVAAARKLCTAVYWMRVTEHRGWRKKLCKGNIGRR